MDLIKFNGTNEKLFSRYVISTVTPKTTLLVPETHNAIIIYNGEMLQTLSKGKYRLSEIVNLDDEGSLEIIFVSKTAKLKLLWGTANKFTLIDPVLKKPYKIGMSGEFEVQVSDPRKCFLYLVGAEEVLTAEALQDRLMSRLVAEIGDVLSKYVAENNLRFDQIFMQRQKIAACALKEISTVFERDYGIKVFSLNISNVIFDDDLAVPDEKVCPSCNTKLKKDAKFCYNCGKKQDEKKICSNCHAENVEDAKFCSFCGQKF